MLMNKVRSIALMLICMLALVACSGGETEPKYTQNFVEGKMISGDSMGVDMDLVAAFFTFTNNSEETVLPCEAIDVKAFQNGTEIPVMVFTGQKTEGSIQCDTSVQSGTTANIVWLFQIEDKSTVTLECSDGQKIEITLD